MITSPHIPTPLPLDCTNELKSDQDRMTLIHRHVQETARLQNIIAPPLLRVQGLSRCGPSEDDLIAVDACFTEYLERIKTWYANIEKKKGESFRPFYFASLTTAQRGIYISWPSSMIAPCIYGWPDGYNVFPDQYAIRGVFIWCRMSADPSFSVQSNLSPAYPLARTFRSAGRVPSMSYALSDISD